MTDINTANLELLQRRADWAAGDRPDVDTVNLLLRNDGHGVFRVQCYAGGCFNSEFDLVGSVEPPAGDSMPSIVRQCIEHVEKCSGRARVKSYTTLRNRNTPQHYLLKLEW